MSQDPVLEALAGQLGCYRRLAKLADLQHEHVRQGRTEQLLALLKSRQEVLEQVSRFEDLVAPAKRRWAQYLQQVDTPDRAMAESLLAETRRLLEEITTADRDDALVLQQRKLNLGKQIQQASSARRRHRGYAAAAYGPRVSRVDLQR